MAEEKSTPNGLSSKAPSEMSDREMHVVASVEEWNKGLSEIALAKKYAILGSSELAFFSGTNHLFWADFSGDERLMKYGNSRTVTWISGNCQFSSFSASGSDSEGPIYGLNEFDESIIADYQYDVWRLATSIVLLAKANGISSEEAQKAVIFAFARRYLRAVIAFKNDSANEDMARLSSLLAITGGNMKGRLVRFLAIVEREYSRKKLLKKWCGDEASFLEIKDSVQPCPKSEEDAVISALGSYADGVNVKCLSRRLFEDASSCGTPRYFVLTEGPDGERHILDVKLQQRPTAYHFMNPEERRFYRQRFERETDRFQEACRMLSPSQDTSTGSVQIEDGIHPSASGVYSVREISPYEEPYPALDSADQRPKLKSFALTTQEAMVELAEDWARILGTQHAKAACSLQAERLVEALPPNGEGRVIGNTAFGREIASLIRAANEKGGFEALVWIIAHTYCRQVEYDLSAFQRHLLR